MPDLKQLREDAGLSQGQLAKICGKVRQTIVEIEAGRNRPSVKLAKQFGVIFGIDWTDFFADIKPF